MSKMILVQYSFELHLWYKRILTYESKLIIQKLQRELNMLKFDLKRKSKIMLQIDFDILDNMVL